MKTLGNNQYQYTLEIQLPCPLEFCKDVLKEKKATPGIKTLTKNLETLFKEEEEEEEPKKSLQFN